MTSICLEIIMFSLQTADYHCIIVRSFWFLEMFSSFTLFNNIANLKFTMCSKHFKKSNFIQLYVYCFITIQILMILSIVSKDLKEKNIFF